MSGATKQSDPKGHSEHIRGVYTERSECVQCKLRQESRRDCTGCPEHRRGSSASQRHFVSDCSLLSVARNDVRAQKSIGGDCTAPRSRTGREGRRIPGSGGERRCGGPVRTTSRMSPCAGFTAACRRTSFCPRPCRWRRSGRRHAAQGRWHRWGGCPW